MGRKSLAEQRRLEIIHAFYHCVNEDGLARASIRKIARQAGVQPSMIHHYFKDRDEMIAEMVEAFADTIFQAFFAEMKRHTDLETRFFKALEFMYSPGMINDEYSGFFLECCVEARRNPRVRATLARTFERFRQTIIEYMEEIPVMAQLPAARKKNYASMLIAIHEGLELQWFIDPEAVSLDKAVALTRQVIDLMVAEVDEPAAARRNGISD
ncbi:MAG: TetR/AcrR family transcriptional regulator [Desulfosudaceae bacterium]